MYIEDDKAAAKKSVFSNSNANEFLIYPTSSFCLSQSIYGIIAVILAIHNFILISHSPFLQILNLKFTIWILQGANILFFLLSSCYFFFNSLIRKVKLTKTELVYYQGFLFYIRKVDRKIIYNCYLKIDEVYTGGNGLDKGGQSKKIVVQGKQGNAIAEIQVNEFEMSNIKKLVSLLKNRGEI